MRLVVPCILLLAALCGLGQADSCEQRSVVIGGQDNPTFPIDVYFKQDGDRGLVCFDHQGSNRLEFGCPSTYAGIGGCSSIQGVVLCHDGIRERHCIDVSRSTVGDKIIFEACGECAEVLQCQA